MKEVTKKMNTQQKLSTPIYKYVLGVYKGCGKSLGEIASEARSFEKDLNCWIDVIEARVGLIR
jgi:hypothetical protein